MNDFATILAKSHCVSQTQLLAYIQNQLDKDEAYLVESHINDCQLCNDALDALMDADLGVVSSDLKEIKINLEAKLFLKEEEKKTVQTITSKEKPFEVSRKTFTRWLAAASVLLIVGLGGYTVFSYITNHKKELAIQSNKEDKKTIDTKYSIPEKSDGEIVKLKIEESDTFKEYAKNDKTSKSKPNIAPEAPKILRENKTNEVSKPAVTDIASVEQEKNIERAMPTPAPVATPAKLEKEIDAAPGMQNYAAEEAKPQKQIALKELRKKTSGGMKYDVGNQNAVSQNNQNNFEQVSKDSKASVQKLDDASNNEADKPLNDFENGMNFFNNQDYKKAIQYFEKAIKNSNENNKEDITYHLALAYEKTNKYSKAEKLFTELANSKKYGYDAEQRLQQIKTKK